MIENQKCENLNHKLHDVKIKHCIDCGEQFSALKTVSCNDIIHAQKRKQRNKFCSDCGVNLDSYFKN